MRLSGSKILYLVTLQRQEDRTLLFQCLLKLNEDRIATKHLQNVYLIFVRVLSDVNYEGTEQWMVAFQMLIATANAVYVNFLESWKVFSSELQ